jgi:hypothetical protein
LNYFADCFALNGRALACRALYFPAQTRRARNQPIFDQQDNLRLEPVEENFYFMSTQFKNGLTDVVDQWLQSARPDSRRAIFGPY